MGENTLDSLLSALNDMYRRGFDGPFPYADCRKIIGQDHKKYEDLTADLNTYFSEVIGSSSWGRRLAEWPRDRMRGVKGALEKTFFERYPAYSPLAPMITASDTPDLYAKLIYSEQLRVNLVKILTLLLSKD